MMDYSVASQCQLKPNTVVRKGWHGTVLLTGSSLHCLLIC